MNHRPFQPHEDKQIYAMAAEGKAAPQIATALGRAKASVYARIELLGVEYKPRIWTQADDARLAACLADRLSRYQTACILRRTEEALDARISRQRIRLPISRREWETGAKPAKTFKCSACDTRKVETKFSAEQLARQLNEGWDSRLCLACESEATTPSVLAVFEPPRDYWAEDAPIGGER